MKPVPAEAQSLSVKRAEVEFHGFASLAEPERHSGLRAGERACSAERGPRPDRSPSASACEAYREAIELGLARGRNAMAIRQGLVGEYGFPGAYQRVKRFVRNLRGA